MTRHSVRTGEQNETVLVGWDPALATYYCQQWIDPLWFEQGEEPMLVFSVGTTHGQLKTASDLAREVQDVAVIEYDLLKALEAEQEQFPPTPLPELRPGAVAAHVKALANAQVQSTLDYFNELANEQGR